MKETHLRHGAVLLGAVILLASCSKNAELSDGGRKRSAEQTARKAEGPVYPDYAPMPVDTAELNATRNPKDI